MNRLIALMTLSLGVSALMNSSVAQENDTSGDASRVSLKWGVIIPLRDGVNLNATLYLRRDSSHPAPCIVTLTPYIADTYHSRGVYFAAHGYPFAIVDVRGRGNSQGQFQPLIQEAHDGYDVVEWLARQPYCNGKVGMWGGSYAGYDQWATAKESPPHLSTIVPAAAPYVGVDFPMRNNIFSPYLIQWLTYTSGNASQREIFADQGFWSNVFYRWHTSGQSFSNLDRVFGNSEAVFQQWLQHPHPDAYWDQYNPTAEQYAKIGIPTLTITGSYDDDQPGALEHYRQLMRYASPAIASRHYLVIGPWDHAGTRTPAYEVGGLRFGDASLVDLPRLHLQWYEWTMNGGAKPDFLQRGVAYYVMGAERWRYAVSLDAATARSDSYFLASEGSADSVYRSGSLEHTSMASPPDSYRYDPRILTGPEVEAELRANGSSLVDQSSVLALEGKELVYQSAPLAADTEITGFFNLSVWLAINCPDTDIYATVYDVDTAGSSTRLSTDAVRARYRESARVPRLVSTTEPLRYEFSHFTFVSRQVKAGHRLRLVVSPTGRLIESTFSEKNYNGGGVVAEEAVNDARAVTVRLFHDRQYQSILRVPIGRPDRP